MAATWLLLISLASTQSGHISGLASRDDTLYKELPESMEKLNAIVRGIYKGVYRFRGEFLLALGKLHEVVVDIQKDVTEIKTNMSDIPDIDKDAYQIQKTSLPYYIYFKQTTPVLKPPPPLVSVRHAITRTKQESRVSQIRKETARCRVIIYYYIYYDIVLKVHQKRKSAKRRKEKQFINY